MSHRLLLRKEDRIDLHLLRLGACPIYYIVSPLFWTALDIVLDVVSCVTLRVPPVP